jgi:phosphotransferase system enzyme I (PtsI)
VTSDRVLNGVGVAPGIVIGPARVIRWELPDVTHDVVSADQVDEEISRLRDALVAVKDLLEDLQHRTRRRAGEEESKIFDAQILMLDDPEFIGEVETLIRENQLSAARAFEFKTLEMRAQWQQSHSYLLRQRVADLTGIQIRVINRLMGKSVVRGLAGPDSASAIVLTRELTPGLTVQLEREQVAGLASVEGAKTAHAAILARSLGIPCVMGLASGLDRIEDGTPVILDGTHGFVLIDPTPAEIAEAEESERLREQLAKRLDEVVGQPAETVDGERLTLRANIDLPEEIDGTADHGAEGVGLLRTEFLVLGRTSMPSEDEQARFFEQVARRFAPNPVVVRTYDLGGDKFPTAFRTDPEANPFLGWRAIRVCLDHPEFFRTQIRAALRATVAGDVRLMLPMITAIEEIERTRELVADEAQALEREGIPVGKTLPVGVMIETPAAAILAEQIVPLSDFVSIGTNDLTQYTLAVDRGNARLAGRFTPHHPAVLRMLARVHDAAKAHGVEASVCGEMASDPLSVFLLIGMGFRVLSVSPPTLPLIRWLVRQIDAAAAAAAARQALSASTTAHVEAVLEKAIVKYIDLELLRAGRLPSVVGPGRLRSFARGSA